MVGSDTAGSAPAGWYPDPTGRHQYRYWNSAAWTGDVADDGVAGVDPLDARADQASAEADRPALTEGERAALAVEKGDWPAAAEIGAGSVDALVDLLRSHENSRVRSDAALALGHVGDVRALDALVGALSPFEHPDGHTEFSPTVVDAAVTALGQIGDPRTVGVLAGVARNGADPVLGWSVQQAVSAIRAVLASRLSQVGDDDLRAVAALDNVFRQPLQYSGYGGPEMEELRNHVDCTDIREIARRELADRATH